MSRTTALRQEIKTRFYPFALERGFVRGKATSGRAPFRRVRDDVIQVFDVQWEKYGKACFVINFGEAPAAGVEFGGRTVPAEKLEPSHCPLKGRLQRWRGGSIRTWFQLAKPWSETLFTSRWDYSPEEVAEQVISCFSELEEWWEKKQEGPHIYIWNHPAAPDKQA
jgi:hypothetical protein